MKMTTKFMFLTVLATLGLTSNVFAKLPEYREPELLARANIIDGFNLPAFTFLSNVSPAINARGDVTFKVLTYGGGNENKIWFKADEDKKGKIVFTAPDERFVTDPTINDFGLITLNTFDDGVTDGIIQLDTKNGKIIHAVRPVIESILHYTYSQTLLNGDVFFRATNEENVRTYYFVAPTGEYKKVIEEGVSIFGSSSSYLFKPAINESMTMVFKRRLGNVGEWDDKNGDEIILLTKTDTGAYSPKVVAQDKFIKKSSQFKSLTNSVALSSNNLVAFVGVLEDGTKAIFKYNNGEMKKLVDEKGEVSEIEMFSPKINSKGQVLFRAKNKEGKRSIFLADQDELKMIVSEGSELPSDLGLAKILSNPNYPAFSGDVDFNDNGDIVFNAIIIGAKWDQEWGSAVYKISPK